MQWSILLKCTVKLLNQIIKLFYILLSITQLIG
ncbi:Uncharacterised protein [Mycobacteroides abscessus subsp. massiliense]|nr:Uncharacterised protein [Mycobacteroides abscessus subsp. massiliense]